MFIFSKHYLLKTVELVPFLLLGCSSYLGSSSEPNTMPETEKLKQSSTIKCYIKTVWYLSKYCI